MTTPVLPQRSNQSLLDYLKSLLVKRTPADATTVVPRGAALNGLTAMEGNNPLVDWVDPLTYVAPGPFPAGNPDVHKAMVAKFANDPKSRPDSAALADRTEAARTKMMTDDFWKEGLSDQHRYAQTQDSMDALIQAGRPEMNPRVLEVLAKLLAKGKAP